MAEHYNPLPGLDTFQDNGNPMLCSPYSPYAIGFYQTRDSLMDVNIYQRFIKNCEMRIRRSDAYSHYKNFIMELGLDHCQVHGAINAEMADLEMHHAIINLFDICLMITEHLLNTVGYVSTFDVVQIVKDEHKMGNIALVMLSKTVHQAYHANPGTFFIHPRMCIGNWPLLIEKYKDGLTQDVAFKILATVKQALNTDETDDNGLLDLTENMRDWSEKYGV